MPDHRWNDRDDRGDIVPEPAYEPGCIVAELIVWRDGPVECTLFRADGTDLERNSAWISASEGSFVCLDDTR